MSEHTLPATTRTALKEWAVACEALGRGEQILLLRKGGIREEHREFRIEHPEFLLFPTYEHQRSDLLKPPARADLERVLRERGSASEVSLRYWARVERVFEVTAEQELRSLALLHIWSDDYAEERLRWKPRKPLHVLALRVYELAAITRLPALPQYGGCKSWLTLEEPVIVEGARPVLGEAQFAARLEQVAQLIGAAEVHRG